MTKKKSSNRTVGAFPCSSCNRSFVKASALADHSRSKHGVPITSSATAASISTTVRNKLVPCTEAGCTQTFPDRRALGLHLESPTHACKRGTPLHSLDTNRRVLSPPDGLSKIYPNESITLGTIPEMGVEITAPVVVARTPTALDSLTLKLGSSLHISAPQQSVIRESSSAPQASKQGRFVEEHVLVEFIPQNLAGRKLQAPTRKVKATKKWTVIPGQQQYNALTALRLRCHPPAVLKANGYTLYTDQINLIGEDAVPAPLKASAYHWGISKRTAIALDCEMVGAGDKNESEIARISAIDYLTGEILIDTLVQPTQFVKDWRTKFSGITKEAMSTAISLGKALQGWPEARAALFEYIDTETVLIGQSLHFDLIALGIQHQRVVDSAILTSEAVGPKVRKRRGLKDLCDQLLNIEVQTDKKLGHDSVEDAFAAREVVLWCVNHPDALSRWGQKQRHEHYSQKKRKGNQKTTVGVVSRRQHPSHLCFGCYTNHEDEMLRWSDVAEDLGYPHPDTGYDPWSD